ncbi:DNA cytosine methyltransferase [Streptomyces mirabilis]|uniref:DNA cytosine methyltransferase n=1 Tax=Streptomyces mirabilis TaxID=68239 RepID=UPI0036385628
MASPVKDVSLAGRRAGLAEGTRSGLWHHVVRAIEALNPCLVVIENVRGLLSSPAGSPGDVEFCPWCLGDTAGQPAVRALGAVLGSLADLRFDARWCMLRAADVGAPHRRERIFLTAWPSGRIAAAEDPDQQSGDQRRQPAPGQAQEGRPRPEPGGRGGVAPTHPEGLRRDQGLTEPAPRQWGLAPALGSSPAAADTPGQRYRHTGPSPGAGFRPPLLAVVLPLFTEPMPTKDGPGPGDRTPPPSLDGRRSPVLHHDRPMMRAV